MTRSELAILVELAVGRRVTAKVSIDGTPQQRHANAAEPWRFLIRLVWAVLP